MTEYEYINFGMKILIATMLMFNTFGIQWTLFIMMFICIVALISYINSNMESTRISIANVIKKHKMKKGDEEDWASSSEDEDEDEKTSEETEDSDEKTE